MFAEGVILDIKQVKEQLVIDVEVIDHTKIQKNADVLINKFRKYTSWSIYGTRLKRFLETLKIPLSLTIIQRIRMISLIDINENSMAL